jgi:hypothetical protein
LPIIFNRVFINESGVYILEKNLTTVEGEKVENQIKVSHARLNKAKTGFSELNPNI